MLKHHEYGNCKFDIINIERIIKPFRIFESRINKKTIETYSASRIYASKCLGLREKIARE